MTSHSLGTYDFSYNDDNVYGHALNLLLRRKATPRQPEIHLDIGCGYGRIAEEIRTKTGRAYIGVDASPDGLQSLKERGFEAHQVVLGGRSATLDRLEEVIAGRAVGSITFLDTVEHIADSDETLQAIGDIARQHLAQVVVSAPNVTHRDIGAKLAFGRWNYTVTGLLDHTHVRLFDRSTLTAVLEKAGLYVVDRNDVIQPVSDQHFPSSHPALAAGTPLNGLLFEAARIANPDSETNQFVWLCAPAREFDRQIFLSIREEARPFITAVVRTQGRRLHTLVEALTCLSGQTDTDFEVVVVGHKLDYERFKAVERVIEDTPEWLRPKIRLVRVENGSRGRPLNVGFAEARGRYIAILDDDDIPFGNWVEKYRELDARAPGRVLRCVSVRQDVTNVEINNKNGLRAIGAPERIYPPSFDFLTHLIGNQSPNNTLAFPRGAFHDLGLRFDETLDTSEDWDYLLRVSAYCGVASSPEITGVYRWWTDHECSATVHTPDEWRANERAILRKQDQTYFILPKGETERLRNLAEAHTALLNEYAALKEARASFVEPLNSIEDAIACGRRLSRAIPNDLAGTLRKGLRWKIVNLNFKFLLAILSNKKRRAYRKKRRIYRQFLREFH